MNLILNCKQIILVCLLILCIILVTLVTSHRENFYSKTTQATKITREALFNPQVADKKQKKECYRVPVSIPEAFDLTHLSDKQLGLGSWENNYEKNSKKVKALKNYFYRRDCPVPLISEMGKYKSFDL